MRLPLFGGGLFRCYRTVNLLKVSAVLTGFAGGIGYNRGQPIGSKIKKNGAGKSKTGGHDMGEYFDTAVLEPGKERLEGYAQAFQKLSDTFREMPTKREQLSGEEIRGIFQDVQETVCAFCRRREIKPTLSYVPQGI